MISCENQPGVCSCIHISLINHNVKLTPVNPSFFRGASLSSFLNASPKPPKICREVSDNLPVWGKTAKACEESIRSTNKRNTARVIVEGRSLCCVELLRM